MKKTSPASMFFFGAWVRSVCCVQSISLTMVTRSVDGGESSNKRARSLAGMLLFGENDTSDWQDTVWEAQLTDALDEHDRQEILMDQRTQSDTDVPVVWRCQIEPKSDLYGDKTGKLLDPEKVIKGRLTELKTHE